MFCSLQNNKLLVFELSNSLYSLFQNTVGAHNLYEAMYLYGMWVNFSKTNDLDVRNGRAWLDFTKNKTFQSTNLKFYYKFLKDKLTKYTCVHTS